MLRRVLLASDGSPDSLAAARWVADLAQWLPDLQITVLHVRPVAIPLGAGGLDFLLPTRPAERAGRSVLSGTLRALAGVRDRVRVQYESGFAPEGIVTVARRGRFDLVVLGRRGLSPLARLVLGSVSQRVIELAPCPVAVIGPGGALGG